MSRKMLTVVLLVALIFTVGITSHAGTDGIWYNVTIPPYGKKQILSDAKDNSLDYFCIELSSGTAESIIGSSNYGGEMKIYKEQGYVKIYYDTVPDIKETVKLYASLTSPANQTAGGNSYCN